MSSQIQDQGRQYAQSRILDCDILHTQKRASLEYRKNHLVMQFDLIRQRKQAGLRRHRDPYAAHDRNPTPIPLGDVVASRGHCHDSTKHPDSSTIGPSQGKWRQIRDIPCDSTLSDTQVVGQYLPATAYKPSATAARAVRPVTNRRDLVKLEADSLQTPFAHSIDGRDAREGLWSTGPLHQVQQPKLTFDDRLISPKPSSREGKSLEHDTSDVPTKIGFQDLIGGHSEKWHINNMSGVGHLEHHRKDNVTASSSLIQDSEARASVLRHTKAKDESISNRIHQTVSYYPLPVRPKPTAKLSGPPANRVSTTTAFMIGDSNPTSNDSLGLNQLAELQKRHGMSRAALKNHTSRPSLKLDTTFLSSEPNEAGSSDNDSTKALAGSTVADALNANELLAETDCLHMPLLERSTAQESILTGPKSSKIDATVEDSELGSNETPLDTIPPPPPPTNSPEPQHNNNNNNNKEIKSNLEDDLETLTLASEEHNSPSPDIYNQLDGTSWEKIDAKGIEQDDAFFHQVTNRQKVGWGEAARRAAWGWIR